MLVLLPTASAYVLYLHRVRAQVDAQRPCLCGGTKSCLCCPNLAVHHVGQHQPKYAFHSEGGLPTAICCKAWGKRLLGTQGIIGAKYIEIGVGAL